VTVIGTGGGQADDVGHDDGVFVGFGAEITSGTGGAVSVTGVGGPGDGNKYGVRVVWDGLITSGGALTIDGTGGGHAGDAGDDVGVGVETDGTISSAGTVAINGTGGLGGGYDYGVLVSVDDGGVSPINEGEQPTFATITGGSGVTVTGQGGGSNGSQGYDDGIHVDSSGVISNSGGTLDLAGTGGASGMGEDDGIRVTGSGSQIEAGGDGLSVDGTGGGAGNSAFSSGVAILDGGQVIWADNPEDGTESIVGHGGTGEGGGNAGLLIDGTGSEIVFDADLSDNSDIEGYAGQSGVAPGYGIQMTDGAEIDGDNEDASLPLYLHADTMMVDATSTLSTPGEGILVYVSDSGTIAGDVSSSFFQKYESGTLTLVGEGNLDLGQLDIEAGTLVFADAPPLSLPDQSVFVDSGTTLTLGAGSSVPLVDSLQRHARRLQRPGERRDPDDRRPQHDQSRYRQHGRDHRVLVAGPRLDQHGRHQDRRRIGRRPAADRRGRLRPAPGRRRRHRQPERRDPGSPGVRRRLDGARDGLHADLESIR
jgi:hypothetical protein